MVILTLPRILTIFSIVILIISLFTPWITFKVPFVGELELSIFDIIQFRFGDRSTPDIDVDNQLGDGGYEVGLGVLTTIVLIFLSLVLTVFSLKSYIFSLVAGITGISAFISWVVTVDLLRSALIANIGGEVNIDILSRLVSIGYGSFLILVFSAVSISTYLIARRDSWIIEPIDN